MCLYLIENTIVIFLLYDYYEMEIFLYRNCGIFQCHVAFFFYMATASFAIFQRWKFVKHRSLDYRIFSYDLRGP